MAEGFLLELPGQIEPPVTMRRKAEAAGRAWPTGTRIVSADSHMLEPDLWFDRFPEHLKDEAPRMIFKDGGWDLSIRGKSMTMLRQAADLCNAMECYPGLSDIEARAVDLDIEGVEKELIFPQRLFGLLMFNDIPNRAHVFGAYNAHIGEVCARSNGRLFPVMIPSYWQPEAAAESVAECVSMGARCLMVPIKPGTHDDGTPILYNHPRMDPLWAAIEASGLPVAFHIGEPLPTDGPGDAGISGVMQMQGFRMNWSQLVFGGVFDRFPNLKTVFVEAGLSWIPGMLYHADLIYNSFHNRVAPKLAHPPSWYWRQHCYATFMTDPIGLRMLDVIGAETALWSSDYPHQESTFGYTRSAIEAVLDAVPLADAQAILGKTALKLFRMED